MCASVRVCEMFVRAQSYFFALKCLVKEKVELIVINAVWQHASTRNVFTSGSSDCRARHSVPVCGATRTKLKQTF